MSPKGDRGGGLTEKGGVIYEQKYEGKLSETLSENSFYVLNQIGPHFTGLSVVRGQEVKKIPPWICFSTFHHFLVPRQGTMESSL